MQQRRGERKVRKKRPARQGGGERVRAHPHTTAGATADTTADRGGGYGAILLYIGQYYSTMGQYYGTMI